MGVRMKTTVDVSDGLLEAAKRLAAERGTTLRALVEQGLRSVLHEHSEAGTFVLEDASVGGAGVRPEVREGGWTRMVELTYEGRGG